MPTPPLSEKEAKRRIALIEKCLKEGHPPKGETFYGYRGAIAEAASREGKSRGASFNWYASAANVIGDPDWSLWERPEPEGREAFNGAAPEGFRTKGRSTLYNSKGEVVAEWVKTTADMERQQQLFREAVAAMADELPTAPPTVAPKAGANDALLNAYILTDYHLGMLAWPDETGNDWNVAIAEEMLRKWFAAAIAQSPPAHKAVFAQLGDFLHWDGLDAVTPNSGHILDADTRFQMVVRTAIRVLREVVQMLLAKYPEVHIIMADANHDPAAGVWLRELFAMHYADEPRITVETSPEPYYCYEHGLTSLFFHHGHKRKLENVDDVFAARFRDVFGRTKYSYAHLGHLHNKQVRETNLMIVEQHRTLAAKDAYAARGGWLSGREASVITYHKDFGEVGRITLTPEMVS